MVHAARRATVRIAATRGAVATLVVLALLATMTTLVLAADPDTGTLTESSGDLTWQGARATGTVSSPAVDLGVQDGCDDGNCDVYTLTVDLPEGFWDTRGGGVDVTIQWDSTSEDFDLAVFDADGTEVASSASAATDSETVRLLEPANGTYEVRVDPYQVADSDYVGLVALEAVTDGAVDVGPHETPPGIDGLDGADPRGLQFSATVPADNQRDSSEPIVDTDLDGNIISCGPSGSSQAAEYASISTDGGDQFHLLGTPPRGQIGSGGGGDCSWDFGDRYPFAYTGLGPLTNFTASMSTDGGATIQTTPISGQTIPGVDRQWTVFLNETDVLLSYNQQQPRQVVVQKATDGGLNYGLRVAATPQNPSFPGPMEALPAEFNPTGAANGRVPYFPWNDGANINFSVSFDEGDTWQTCQIATSLGDPTLFVTGDHDSDGNIFVAWGEDTSYHVFASFLTPDLLTGCDEPVTLQTTEMPTTNPGWSSPVQVTRNEVRTAVFPWLVASGEPGRVAVAFYGTATDGDPNSGDFEASWDVYVSQSLNMLDDDATFAQVKATTHPFHYDSICQEGLGCDIFGGDRSLADFFAIDHDPVRDALVISYDQGSKRPGDAEGFVATPAVVRQVAGPGNAGTTVDIADRQPVRTGSADPTGDAITGYSTIGLEPLPQSNQPAVDFTSVQVGPELDLDSGAVVEDGGFTVTMTIDDLSDDALQQAAQDSQSQSLMWIFRFVDGFQASAVGAHWNPITGFGAGYSEYLVDSGQCGGTGGTKCLQYPLDLAVGSSVDQEAGTITLSVPRSYLTALSPEPDATDGYAPRFRPEEVAAEAGDRFYDATAFSLGNSVSATPQLHSWLYPFDNTPAFDFRLSSGDLPLLDEVVRLGGDDRFATAVLASQAQYPEDGSAGAVVIARGDDPNGYADALAGVPFAHQEDAPLLIVLPDDLPDDTAEELQRVLAPGGTVHVLGGPAAVSPAVEEEIRDLGYTTDRVQGDDRIRTAVAIAERLGNPDTLFLTTGFDFPDALAAGTAAAVVDGAVLLTGQETRAEATDDYLERFPDAELFAVGGPSARPYPEATPVFGDTREDTAVAVADTFFDGPAAVGIARSDAFPDALSGGPLMASLGGPVLLTPTNDLADATEGWLCDNADTVALANLFGGTVAIAPAVEVQLGARIVGDGC